jgi:hypothetical protein
MAELRHEALERYLATLLGRPVRVVDLAPLGTVEGSAVPKGYGYGIPLRVDYEAGGSRHRAVLETMKPGPFGHEHAADRAQALLAAHPAYNRLPRHVRSLGVGAVDSAGELVPLERAEEFFILTEFVEGREYARDLERLAAEGALAETDLPRADALCDYLVEIHGRRGGDPGLYARRLRELVGHGECVMGLTDSYPPRHPFISAPLLEEIEHRCVAWRWRLKGRVHRLRQVHGDFHPWNLLFREGADFTALDRSRGEWGEPADDVTCLTINYLFFSLRRSGRLEGPFETLFRRFWSRYVSRSGDSEMVEVAAPFFAFRALVLASPVWYPALPEGVRRKLFAFARNVLDSSRFDPAAANAYCED